eukprot:2405561-Amphidinium_carterae.1
MPNQATHVSPDVWVQQCFAGCNINMQSTRFLVNQATERNRGSKCKYNKNSNANESHALTQASTLWKLTAA